jgi:hypothetical protein
VLIDPRHLADEAAQVERRSRAYVIVTGFLILFVAFAFIWLTW